MSDKTTLQENASGAIQDADSYRGVQNGGNVRFSFTQTKTYIMSWILSIAGVFTNKTISAITNTILIPFFSASLSASQTGVASNTATKLAINSKLSDVNNWYDNAAFRFTPQLAGKWEIKGHLSANGTNLTEIDIYVYFNGASHDASFNVSAATTALSIGISKILHFNGTTDFAEIFGLGIVGAGTVTFLGGVNPIRTWFEARYLGA